LPPIDDFSHLKKEVEIEGWFWTGSLPGS